LSALPAKQGVCRLLDRHGGLYRLPQDAKQVLGAHRSADLRAW
jgi:hypothetical protein